VRPKRFVPVAAEPMRAKARVSRKLPVSFRWVAECPQGWEGHVERIAQAMRTVGSVGHWHELFLALAGELVVRKVMPEVVPAIMGSVARAVGTDAHAAVARARTTLERWSCGGSLKTLAHTSWSVRDVVAECTATGAELKVYQARAATLAAPTVDLAKVCADIDRAIAKAPDGVTLIVASCGLGKTRSAIRVAQERDEVEHTGKTNVRTTILVPTHALAKQVHAKLPRSLRLYGALSAEGEAECKYKRIAEPLVRGGQGLYWNFCSGRGMRRCDVYETCTAKDGQEGREDGRITIASHAKTATVAGKAGVTELVVSDEPPPILKRQAFTREDFAHARASWEHLEDEYAAAISPAFLVLEAWSGPDQPERIDVSQLFPPGQKGGISPRIRWRSMLGSHYQGAAHVAILARLSALLDAVYQFFAAPHSVVRMDGDELVMTYPDMAFVRLLRRQGRVVLLDANGVNDLPIYEMVVGYKVNVAVFDAPDGAPISRTLLRTRDAMKSSWLTFDIDARKSFGRALKAAVSWILERPAEKVAIITMAFVERVLRLAWGEVVPHPTHEETLMADYARPELTRLEGVTLVFGHYGGLRGLDHMADCDALLTLGDHRHNLDDVEAQVAFLGISQTAEERGVALCRAELEQAHGRLRTIHRTKPARSLHVGNVLPSGQGWGAAEVRAHEGGRPTDRRASYGLVELVDMVRTLGGQGATARLLDLSRPMITQCMTGQRALSIKHYRQLVQECGKIYTSNRSPK